MADKKLNISADLKIRTTEAEKVLKKLEKEGIKISKILKGLDIETSGGRAGFAKSLVIASKEMQKLRGVTGDTAKTMEYLWGRQIEKQTKNLDTYTKKVQSLNKLFQFQQAGIASARAAGNEAAAQRMQGIADRTASKIAVNEAARQAISDNLRDLKGGGGGGLTTQDKAFIAFSVGAALGGLGAQLTNWLQGTKTAVLANEGTVAQFHGNMMRRIAGGDFLDAAIIGKTARIGSTGTHGLGILKHAAGTKLGTAGTTLGNMGSVAGTAASLLGAGLSGGTSGLIGSGGRVTDTVSNINRAAGAAGGALGPLLNQADYSVMGGKYVQEAASIERAREAMRMSDPYYAMRFEHLQQTAGGRLAASRRLGGRHMGIAGHGVGAGMDMMESFGLGTGIANQFGGVQALRATPSAMRFSLQGFDPGLTGGMLGRLNEANNKGDETLKRIIGQGTKLGMEQLDIQFFEKFGQAVAEGAIGQGGRTGAGGNFAEALMFGMNRNSSMIDVMGNITGQKALSGVLSGKNPFFNAVGYELGKNILGPDASGIKMQAFQRASLQELIGGSEELTNLGISPKERQRMLGGKLDALTRAFLSEGTSEGNFLLGGAREAGGMQQFLSKSERGRQLMASVLKATLPDQFGDYQTALGATNFMAGVGSPISAGGQFKSTVDGTALMQLQTQAKIAQQIWADEAEIRGDMVAAMQNSVTIFKSFASEVPIGLEGAEKALTILDRVFASLKRFEELDKAVNVIEKKTNAIETRATFGGQKFYR